MTLEDARNWLHSHGKEPCSSEGGWWRWILPDAGYNDLGSKSELPQVIFERLAGDDRFFPWLFESRSRAYEGAVKAVAAALP
jgi:hypothetical protein